MSEQAPRRIAIIGGGCAAMAAAFELTRPEHGGRHEVTVYQVGWRLGGKGASGRGAADRIEEHGFHIWLGFYENAFRLMRECYAELGRDPATCRISEWTDAFRPDPQVGVMESRGGSWIPWAAAFPPQPGLPGDPMESYRPLTVTETMVRAVSLLRHLLVIARQGEPGRDTSAGSPGAPPGREALVASLSRALRYGGLLTAAALLEWLRTLETMLSFLPRYGTGPVMRVLDLVASSAQGVLAGFVQEDAELSRIWACFDVVLASLRGAVRHGLAFDPRGFDAIDEYDCREWLRLHGASAESVDSAFIRGLYDLAFARDPEDHQSPSLSAAQALRGAIRLLWTYRGALFWKMQAGMGDVVFAPLYEVLRRRGVRFQFFHRLENVGIAEDEAGPHVASLDFDVQARVTGGGEYEPLVDVRGLPCWPSAPDLAQLEGADFAAEGWDFESFWDRRRVGRETLRVGEDFDLVVLGVGLGAVPHVCREILERDERWRAMTEHVKTIATQSVQLWLREDMAALGWTGERVNMTAFVKPYETWADMTHLVPEEDSPETVGAIAYLASSLETPDVADRDDRDYPARERERARRQAVDFLDREVRHLWPRSARRGAFRWELLSPPTSEQDSAQGEARLDSQYVRANVNPSDRYVLSVPGSSRYRISPLDDTYDNLTICGDWTACGFNGGCVEAAVMSGQLAAHATCGSPRLEDIVGYDHP